MDPLREEEDPVRAERKTMRRKRRKIWREQKRKEVWVEGKVEQEECGWWLVDSQCTVLGSEPVLSLEAVVIVVQMATRY